MSTKKENIDIWNDTKKRFHESKHELSDFPQSIVYDKLNLTPFPQYSSTIVNVMDMDTLTCCQLYKKMGYNVMGLNMAHPSHPGGGVGTGCFAQEENCFRRSYYFAVLPKTLYPIPETGCIYSPKVTVIKDNKYNLLQQPFTVAMVACAALRNPKINGLGRYCNEEDKKLMKYKIEQIFQVGYKHNHEVLVLGALGCGCFSNPPEVVAELFNEVIEKYKGCFKIIIFAVMSHNDNNFLVFDKIINKFSYFIN